MKKTLTLTTLALLGGAVSVYSQGSVGLGDGNDSGGSFGIQIFQGQAGSTVPVSYGGFSGLEKMGNSGDDLSATTAGPSYNTSPGNAVYGANSALGAGYSIQLLAANGTGIALNNLVPVGPVVSAWYAGTQTHGFGGYWQTSGVAVIPSATAGGSATVAIAAWNNEGGTITSLAAAQAAGDPWGISNTGNVSNLGGGIITPPSLPTTLQSFSLVSTPEPSTIALGVIGASTLLFRRRK